MLMTTQQVHADIEEAQASKDAVLKAVAYSQAAEHYGRLPSSTAKGLATKYANLSAKWETRAGLAEACESLTFDA